MRWSAALTRGTLVRLTAPSPSTTRVVFVMMRSFQLLATSAGRPSEEMPGWCSSRSRQKSRPKV